MLRIYLQNYYIVSSNSLYVITTMPANDVFFGCTCMLMKTLLNFMSSKIPGMHSDEMNFPPPSFVRAA